MLGGRGGSRIIHTEGGAHTRLGIHKAECKLPNAVLRVARGRSRRRKNKEKDPQREKIKVKIIPYDLRDPPKYFTPLFGEVAKFRTLTEKEQQQGRDGDEIERCLPQNT